MTSIWDAPSDRDVLSMPYDPALDDEEPQPEMEPEIFDPVHGVYRPALPIIRGPSKPERVADESIACICTWEGGYGDDGRGKRRTPVAGCPEHEDIDADEPAVIFLSTQEDPNCPF